MSTKPVKWTEKFMEGGMMVSGGTSADLNHINLEEVVKAAENALTLLLGSAMVFARPSHCQI
jgi:hypothetical protein